MTTQDKARQKRAECIRTVANWSRVEKQHIFDQGSFNVDAFSAVMEKASPKLIALFNNIDELDAQDKARDGKQYKHMIFTDVKQAQYGVKLLAAAFAAKGYKHLYNSKFEVQPEKELQNYKNFATLCSSTIYGKPMPVRFRKKILSIFNERPDNVYGENLRFILLDKGFKEGIDLFDVKYIHLFEPLVSTADEKQAVGRGTRFCGQKGLEFQPNKGWELHVYHYEASIPEDLQEKYQATRMSELFLQQSGIDLRRLIFANTLEKTTMQGAVDYPLTRSIHSFGEEQSPSSDIPGLRSLFDVKPLRPLPPSQGRPEDVFDRSKMLKPRSVFDRFKGPLFDRHKAKQPAKLKQSGGKKEKSYRPMAPRTKMSSRKMQEYILKRFKRYMWPPMKLENLCGPPPKGGAAPSIVEFTPTQDFLRNYFNPSSVYKGLLLWHGTGVGKTCSAMAIASTSFEKQGYTILWVTRHTLKADIWKNMFQQVCSLVIKERIRSGEAIPEDAIHHPLKYLSKAWMEPISYKQFSNLLEGKNDLYHRMVARNGKEDPLRKTLVIMDEAHKLFAPDLLPSERPNVKTLRERIHHSYDHSKENSCKVLLMTATPYNTDPMELISLLNLLRPSKDAIPNDFEDFSKEYLEGDTGAFSTSGRQKYMDDISGYVSYLNREKDARQFAIPKFHNKVVSISRSDAKQIQAQIDQLSDQIKSFDQDLLEGKDAVSKAKQKIKQETAVKLAACDSAPRGTKKQCQDKIRQEMKDFQAALLSELEDKMENTKADRKELLSVQKTLQKKLKDVKSDLSQEAALQTRCFESKK